MPSENSTLNQDGMISESDVRKIISDMYSDLGAAKTAEQLSISKVYIYLISGGHKPITAKVAKALGYERIIQYRKIQSPEIEIAGQ